MKQTKQILHKLSKDAIQSIGLNREIRKVKRWLLIPAVLVIASFILAVCDIDVGVPYVFMAGIISFLVIWVGANKKGNKLWDRVKDLPEPVNLDEVK